MSKIKETLRRFKESLDAEATRIEEAIAATKQDIRESVEEYLDFETTKEAYKAFYISKLVEADVESEDEMDDETKEKFKKDVEESWEGGALEDKVIEFLQSEAVVTPEFKSDDPRENEGPAKGQPNVKDEGGDVIDPPKDTIADPAINKEAEANNKTAAPEKEKVDDQTDVSQEEPKVNTGEDDTSGDPLK